MVQVHYFHTIKKSVSSGLAKFALPFLSSVGTSVGISVGIMVVLTACSVSELQSPQPVFNNTDNTQHLFTLNLLEGDTQKALEEEYSAEVMVWKPEAGFAILGSSLDSDLLPQSLELDSNKNSIELPVSALSKGRGSGNNGWALAADGWASGGDGWVTGPAGWATGSAGWAAGVNTLYLKNNKSAWEQIDLFGAHASSATLGKGVKIAVIDTGIDLSHPMFAQSLAPQTEWRDYVDYDYSPQDEMGGRGSGHGTAVAGIILQVAPQATILPIRVLNQNGFGDMDHVIYAIDHAIASGAQIINLSLGADSNSKTLRQMMLYAKSQGVFTAAAAGNTGKDDNLLFPAKMSSWKTQLGSIYAVGSVSNDDEVSRFSTARKNNIVFAPGEDIRTAFPGSRLANVTGTSFATPLFAGSLALVYSELSNTTEKEDMFSYVRSGLERERIEDKYYKNGGAWRHGNGVLNVNAFLNATKLSNPSFETATALNEWNKFNTTTTTVFNGKKYFQSGDNIASLSSGGYLRQGINDLQPNTTYEVSMLVGFDTSTGQANISISNFANGGKSIDKSFSVDGKTNKLRYVKSTFMTGESNTYALLEIKNHNARGTLFIDELRLKVIN